MFKNSLLAGAAVAALISTTSAYATDADAAAVETIVVFGEGQTHAVQALTAQDLQTSVPGTSPLKVVSKLPGVNFQSADAFGSYEWSTRISIRGFNQKQTGFTLDGVPLGNMDYDSNNGLHISRAIATENLGRVELAQGTGALGTASTSNLGGTLQFHSIDPAGDLRIYASATGGSYDTAHLFARLDSGELPGGGTGFISFTQQYADKWKGDGIQKQQLINGKFVQPVGSSLTLTAYADYSQRRENDYQDLSPALIRAFGYDFDNNSRDYTLAKAMGAAVQRVDAKGKSSPGPAPAPFTNVPIVSSLDENGAETEPYTDLDYYDSYYNAAGLRNDFLAYVKADWDILDNLSLHTTGYAHVNKGEGIWFTPDNPTPVTALGPTGKLIAEPAPISLRTTEYGMNRYGITSNLNWSVGGHDIELGIWYEDNLFHQARRYYGLAEAASDRPSLQFQDNPYRTKWAFRFDTTTFVFHLGDSWQVTDAFRVDYGFKTQQQNISSATPTAEQAAHAAPDTQLGGSAFGAKIKATAGFLPQIAANYRIDRSNEVFADFAQNQEAFDADAGTGELFSTTAKAWNGGGKNLKPETSDTYELGYRLHDNDLQALITGYYVKFHNRQLATTVGAIIAGRDSAFMNVGSVTTKGIEGALQYRFLDTWSLFGSYAYNDSTYDDDTFDGDHHLVAKTGGKIVVDAPKNIFKAELGFDDGSIFGGVDVSYMSKRYYTYTDDASVGAQSPVDLNLGYRFDGDSFLGGLEAQLNVTNLFDENYVATIGSGGFEPSDPNGYMQTLLAGAPREIFFSLRKQF